MILAFQNFEFKILGDLKILAFQNPEFNILGFQKPEFKITAHFKILAFQNPEFKILAQLKILAFQYPEFKILADLKILAFKNPELKEVSEWASYGNYRKVTQNQHFLEKLQKGDEEKFFKNRLKSNPCLKSPIKLCRKWHYSLIIMHLKGKDWKRFWRKQRL